MQILQKIIFILAGVVLGIALCSYLASAARSHGLNCWPTEVVDHSLIQQQGFLKRWRGGHRSGEHLALYIKDDEWAVYIEKPEMGFSCLAFAGNAGNDWMGMPQPTSDERGA